jgi:hypothetical protein
MENSPLLASMNGINIPAVTYFRGGFLLGFAVELDKVSDVGLVFVTVTDSVS